MALPRVSLKSFLSSAKSALQSPPTHASPHTFVIGNESADLDSLCSAVVLAYLCTYSNTRPPSAKGIYIPLSNIPRADLALRPELTAVVSRANLKPEDLISLSDLPPRPSRTSQLPPENTRWLLIDHNALQGELGDLYGKRVVGCIDHHDEEGKVPQDCGEEPRIIQKTGSCSSLVVEHCKQGWEALSVKKSAETAAWDSELAHLALGPILIDTTNLTHVNVTSVDRDAAKYAKSLITAKLGGDFDSDEFYNSVTEAKLAIDDLSLRDILRKDYKQWTEAGNINLGISSVVKDMNFLLGKAGSAEKLYEALKKFAEERDLSICSIMTTSHDDGKFKRELLVWALNDRGVKAIKIFERDSTETLGLQIWNDGSLDLLEEKQRRRCWEQQRIENSRKQVAPLLRNSMSDESHERL